MKGFPKQDKTYHNKNENRNSGEEVKISFHYQGLFMEKVTFAQQKNRPKK